jgi:hypothetical protein
VSSIRATINSYNLIGSYSLALDIFSGSVPTTSSEHNYLEKNFLDVLTVNPVSIAVSLKINVFGCAKNIVLLWECNNQGYEEPPTKQKKYWRGKEKGNKCGGNLAVPLYSNSPTEAGGQRSLSLSLSPPKARSYF